MSWYNINILVFRCWAIWRVITCLELYDDVSSILHNIKFPSSRKHYQTSVHNVQYGNSFLLHIWNSCSPQIPVCFISSNNIQILNSATSDEIERFAFSFQNSATVTNVRHFFKFQVCATNVRINYDFIPSKRLNIPNLSIKWATMWYPWLPKKRTQFAHAQ